MDMRPLARHKSHIAYFSLLVQIFAPFVRTLIFKCTNAFVPFLHSNIHLGLAIQVFQIGSGLALYNSSDNSIREVTCNVLRINHKLLLLQHRYKFRSPQLISCQIWVIILYRITAKGLMATYFSSSGLYNADVCHIIGEYLESLWRRMGAFHWNHLFHQSYHLVYTPPDQCVITDFFQLHFCKCCMCSNSFIDTMIVTRNIISKVQYNSLIG